MFCSLLSFILKNTPDRPLFSRQACRSLHRSPLVDWLLNVVCFVVFSHIAVVLRSFLHLFAMRVCWLLPHRCLVCFSVPQFLTLCVQWSVFRSTLSSQRKEFRPLLSLPRFLRFVWVCVSINLRLLLQCPFLCWTWVLFLWRRLWSFVDCSFSQTRGGFPSPWSWCFFLLSVFHFVCVHRAQVLNFMPGAMVVVCYYSCHHFLSLSSLSFAAIVFCMCLQLVSLSFIRVIAFHDRSVVSGWLADSLALAGVRIDHRSFLLELLQAAPARPLPPSTVSCEIYIQETNKFNSQSRITTARN